MRLKNKFLNFILILFVLFAIADSVFLFALPSSMTPKVQNYIIEKLVKLNTYGNIEVKMLPIKTYSDFSIELNSQYLRFSDEKKNIIISADNINLRVPLIPLIFKQIYLSKMNLNKLAINLDRDEQGKYNFEKLFKNQNANKFNYSIKNIKCNIQEYDVNFEDNYLNKQVALNGSFFKINKFVQNKFIDLDVLGVITSDKTNKTPLNLQLVVQLPIKSYMDLSKDVLEGYIENFNIEYFKPYLAEYIGKDIKTAKGIASFEFHTEKNPGDETKKIFNIKGSISDLFLDKTSLKGIISSDKPVKIDLALAVDKNKFEWKNADISSEKYKISSIGSIDFSDKVPVLDINVSVPNSRTEEIVKIIPANIIPKRSQQYDAIRKAKEYSIYGNFNGNVIIKGKANSPEVTGYILCDNVKLFSASEPTHNATVDMKFQGDILKILVNVMLENGEYTKVDGYVYIHSDGVNHFEIATSENLNFPIAQKIVLPIQDTLKFELGPIPEMIISKGTGNINMKIDGTKENGSIYGTANFKDSKVGYYGLNGTVENAIGTVSFEDKEVLYNSDGYLYGYKIYVSGRSIQNSHTEINFGSNAIDASKVVDLINNSPLLSEIKSGISALKDITGKIKIDVMLRGNSSTFSNKADKLNNITVRGSVYLFNNSFKLQNFKTPFESIKGIVQFSDKSIDFHNITALIGKSPFSVDGDILINKKTRIPNISLVAKGDNMYAGDTLRLIFESDSIKNAIPFKSLYNLDSVHDLDFTYKAESSDFDINKINAEINFKPTLTKSPVYIATGKINLKNSEVIVQNTQGKFFNTVADFSGKINKINTQNPIYNFTVKIKNFDFITLTDIENLNIIPQTIKRFIQQYKNFKGKADLDFIIKNNNIIGTVDLSEVTLTNKTTGITITIPRNKLELKGNKLVAKSLDITVGQTPLFGDFSWTDIGKKNSINAHLTTKFTNDILAAMMKNYSQNQIKIIGDAGLTADIKGDFENLVLNTKLTLNPKSDLLYRNSSIGNCDTTRELVSKINLNSNGIEIEKADAYRLNPTANGRQKQDILSLKGNIIYSNGDMKLSTLDLNIPENLSVRFLNPIFKTNIFSQGYLSGNIKYKLGENHQPYLQGKIQANRISLPSVNATIEQLIFNADKDNIAVNLEGLISGSDIKIHSNIQNKLSYPINVNSLSVSSYKLSNTDVFNVLNNLRQEFLSVRNSNKTNLSNTNIFNIINGQLKIDKFMYNNLEMDNLTSDYTLDDSNILEFKNIKANVGEGKLVAEGRYNFPSSDLAINIILDDVQSEDIAENFFGTKNQIYGNGYGKLNISTKGTESSERVKNLNGNCYFVISDGAMPVLGSLEYLLRASNIVNSGVSGLTINGVLDLMNFAKTGGFSSINGEFQIQNGIVKDINVYSQGTNLSMYLKGKYDIINSQAKIDIWGKLSNKIPSLLGPIGNTSINSFFSMIPGITPADSERREFNHNIDKIPMLEYSNNDYRIFKAIIDGNINSSSSEFVKVFKWVQ